MDIFQADLSSEQHAQTIIKLLDMYATDLMGGAKALTEYTKQNLIIELKKRPGTLVVLAYENITPVGLAICFEGFSTFYCKPLMNIHDFVVVPQFRGKNLAVKMLEKIEEIAKQKGCCKLTLEVLERNFAAQSAYSKFGFKPYQLNPEMGKALFWEKKI